MTRFSVTTNLLDNPAEILISESEFNDAKAADAAQRSVQLLEERFDSLAANFLEFEGLVVRRLLEFEHIGHIDGNHQMFVRRDANRVLMNVLGSARGYIDQLPQVAKALFGENDARTVECADILRRAYDTTAGYRIFEALRDHAQHAGYPAHLTAYETTMLGEFPNLVATKRFQVLARPDILSANRQFKPAILAELKGMGDQVDLRPLLCQYVAGIAMAHYYVRDQSAPVGESASATLEQILLRYYAAFPGEKKPPGVHVVKSEDGRWLEQVPLGTGNERYVANLRSINTRLDEADRTFLIGTVDKDA